MILTCLQSYKHTRDCIINPTKNPTFSSFHPLSHALAFYTIHTSYTYTYTLGGKEMKDRMERFVILPFSLGCSTQSSVAVATTHQHKKPNQLMKRREESDANGSFKKEEYTKMDDNGANISDEGREESDKNGLFKKEYTKMDNNNGANISDGIYKIIRSFKSFSHFFIRYEEETKEREAEMGIGFPTDVKHLSHIGVDGTMTTFDVSSSSFPFASFHLTAV